MCNQTHGLACLGVSVNINIFTSLIQVHYAENGFFVFSYYFIYLKYWYIVSVIPPFLV
ncbi:Uncharacterised protein [Chlamydia trachomatis]|nr:Uncharacterised protein [Chlamydia trachomatis]